MKVRAQMFEKVFLAHIMSTFVAESDKLYYVNLRNEAKSLKTKEIRDFEGRDRVAERGASPANIYIVKPGGGFALRSGMPTFSTYPKTPAQSHLNPSFDTT